MTRYGLRYLPVMVLYNNDNRNDKLKKNKTKKPSGIHIKSSRTWPETTKTRINAAHEFLLVSPSFHVADEADGRNSKVKETREEKTPNRTRTK